MAHLEVQVPKGLLVQMVVLDHKVLLDQTVHLEVQVPKGLLVQMVHQDLKDLQAHPDHQALKVQQVDLQLAQMLKLIH